MAEVVIQTTHLNFEAERVFLIHKGAGVESCWLEAIPSGILNRPIRQVNYEACWMTGLNALNRSACKTKLSWHGVYGFQNHQKSVKETYLEISPGILVRSLSFRYRVVKWDSCHNCGLRFRIRPLISSSGQWDFLPAATSSWDIIVWDLILWPICAYLWLFCSLLFFDWLLDIIWRNEKTRNHETMINIGPISNRYIIRGCSTSVPSRTSAGDLLLKPVQSFRSPTFWPPIRLQGNSLSTAKGYRSVPRNVQGRALEGEDPSR